jgi:hypothetical protein
MERAVTRLPTIFAAEKQRLMPRTSLKTAVARFSCVRLFLLGTVPTASYSAGNGSLYVHASIRYEDTFGQTHVDNCLRLAQEGHWS